MNYVSCLIHVLGDVDGPWDGEQGSVGECHHHPAPERSRAWQHTAQGTGQPNLKGAGS